MRALAAIAVLLIGAVAWPLASVAEDVARTPNGFSLSGATVDPDEILAGGPKRDGIRSIDDPGFAAPEEAVWVSVANPVLGVELAGDARVFPVHLMEYHQIVNDTIGGVPVVVTYDPLSGVPLAFRRKLGERTLDFGVSGLVYRSNLLLYDRQTESLWSQLLGRAITGPLAGTTLVRVPIRQEPLAVFLARYPSAEVKVLKRPARERIDYRYSPFSEYWVSTTIPFPVPHRDERFHPKDGVVGVEADGERRAYLGSRVHAAGGRVVDQLAGKRIRVAYDTNTSTFQWDVPEGVRVTEAYWFAWKAFAPDTSVWNEAGPEGEPTVEKAAP